FLINIIPSSMGCFIIFVEASMCFHLALRTIMCSQMKFLRFVVSLTQIFQLTMPITFTKLQDVFLLKSSFVVQLQNNLLKKMHLMKTKPPKFLVQIELQLVKEGCSKWVIISMYALTENMFNTKRKFIAFSLQLNRIVKVITLGINLLAFLLNWNQSTLIIHFMKCIFLMNLQIAKLVTMICQSLYLLMIIQH
ncbi:hypothetical protein ROZALSC1DRAFT_31142, partial [Rozella allomycis CSF55]